MVDLKLSLLGTPKITRTDHSVNIQRRKGIALLSYLAVTAQPHSRDSLATTFWPEYDQSGARGNLRRDLSRLKTELGDGALRIEADNVGMHPQLDLWLDVAEFQASAERPQQHGHSLNGQGEPLCPGCLESLQRAVELYQGDFLGGLNLPDSPAFNEWQFFQSESLRQKMAIALQHLVRWYTYNRAFSEAIQYCRRWLSMDPLHEPAHRELMRLYAYDGQVAAALRQYQECARLLKAELGIDPESETTRLYEEIRSRKIGPVEAARPAAAPRAAAPPRDGTSPGDGASLQDGVSLQDSRGPAQEAAAARPRHNLPVQSTPFVGRESELTEIRRLLIEDPSCRLVTLLGPGGSGKTRLGLQSGLLASRHEDQAFPDGVWFVQLAPLTEPASIVSAIAQALRRSFFLEQEHPERRLIENLRRERLLLILDNFEHLQSPEAVGLVSEILESAPGVKIMVTSRTRLNVRGEHLFFLGGLSVPGTGISLAELSAGGGGYSALELFLQSARRMWPGFKLDESSYRTIVQICSQVQGMPLAIELAAGWLGALSVEEIREEVESSLDFLESEWRDLPDRQRSLRAVFNSSWKLLSGEERQMVKALSIFRSGFSREAARAVAGASPKGLLGLMNKSWVGRQPEERYGIHELLRQYAFERLSLDSGNLRETQERYSSYYAGYGGSLWAMMQGPEQGKANKAIHLEFDNFGAAWAWFVSSGQTGRAVSDLLPPLFLYSEAHSKSFELLQMVAAALHSLPGPDGDPELSFVEGVLTTVRGAFFKTGFPVRFETFGMFVPAEKEAIRRSWELVGSQSRPESDGFWTIISAYLYGRALDYDGAIARFDELLPELRRQGRLWEWAFGLLHRETIVLSYQRFMSQPDQVDGNLEEARLVFQELGDRIQCGHVLRQQGKLRVFQVSYPEAIRFWQAAQVELRAGGERVVAADIYWQIGDAYLQLGQFEQAFESFRRIFQAYLEMGYLNWAASVKSKESFEALRYSDIEHARRTREESLALARESQDKLVEAWGDWEMGEIWRVAGGLDEARRWYEEARRLFEVLYDDSGFTFYYRGLGDVALAEGDYEAACAQFALSMKSARATDHDWALAYALAGMGKAETGLGQFESASARFKEALAIAKKSGNRGITLMILAGLAGLQAASGQREQAARLAALVAEHYASWRETREQARRLLEAASGGLPPECCTVSQAEAEAQDLWPILEKLSLFG